jgi:hypothetical protein
MDRWMRENEEKSAMNVNPKTVPGPSALQYSDAEPAIIIETRLEEFFETGVRSTIGEWEPL